LSGEHYLSKAVLMAMGGKITIDGVPWLPTGEKREIGVNNLTARVLCKRHNSALSPLDAVAGEFFSVLRNINTDLTTKSLSRKRSHYFFSGEELELWMLKTLCGMIYSGNALADGVRLLGNNRVDYLIVQSALEVGLWPANCGLHMKATVGFAFQHSNSV